MTNFPELVKIKSLSSDEAIHITPVYIFNDDPQPILSDIPPNERVIVLDMAPDGSKILKSQSYSDTWQIVQTDLHSVPQLTGTSGASMQNVVIVVGVEQGHLTEPPNSAVDINQLAALFNQRYI